jgi:hypothetical protein
VELRIERYSCKNIVFKESIECTSHGNTGNADFVLFPLFSVLQGGQNEFQGNDLNNYLFMCPLRGRRGRGT